MNRLTEPELVLGVLVLLSLLFVLGYCRGGGGGGGGRYGGGRYCRVIGVGQVFRFHPVEIFQ